MKPAAPCEGSKVAMPVARNRLMQAFSSHGGCYEAWHEKVRPRHPLFSPPPFSWDISTTSAGLLCPLPLLTWLIQSFWFLCGLHMTTHDLHSATWWLALAVLLTALFEFFKGSERKFSCSLLPFHVAALQVTGQPLVLVT